jgi:phosphopantothenoylcysteine decarboxylase/phosphopantothenate--cysteine ligase
MRHGAEVFPVMSDAAEELIRPALLEWACEKPVVTRLTGRIEHVRLGTESDVVLVCPATANTISKIAHGIDDTPVTSVVSCALGAGKKLFIVPATHGDMYANPFVKESLQKLEAAGARIIPPVFAEEKAKLADVDGIVAAVLAGFTPQDMAGQRVIVTAGPTFEQIDAVRGITNMSSGKMGIELARNAAARGAEVTLIYGPGSAPLPGGMRVIKVVSAEEMIASSLDLLRGSDALVSAAAIADFTPKLRTRQKISSGQDLVLALETTPKLVAIAKQQYPGKVVVAFKLEPENVLEKALDKLRAEGLDMVVANHTSAIGSDENDVFIIDRHKTVRTRGSKAEVAARINDCIAAALRKA